MPVVYSALMCVAPAVHPAVSGAEAARCAGTTRAMREAADRLVRTRPDRVVLLLTGEAAVHAGPHRAELGGVRVELPDWPELARSLGLAARPGLPSSARVPLAFVAAAGWAGPTAVVAVAEPGDAADLGRALAAAPGRTAVLGAGVLSQRLRPDAPLGFHPQAVEFDRAFLDALRAGGASGLSALPWRVESGEQMLVAAHGAAACVDGGRGADVIHYEAPWGVGYAVAVLHDAAPPLYAVARRALADRFDGRASGVPMGGPAASPVFVALGLRGGESRGCVGHLVPRAGSLYGEVAEVTLAAAFEDCRTAPLCAWELGDLDIEVLLLDPPEPVSAADGLDPRRHGVIVTAADRCGVQLPGRAASPEALVASARQRAGIAPGAPAALARFTVRTERRP